MRSALFSKTRILLILVCGPALLSAGSILLPNAGVEVYRDWMSFVEYKNTQERIGTITFGRSTVLVGQSYGLRKGLLIGADVELDNLYGRSDLQQTGMGASDIRLKWNFWSKLGPGNYHRLSFQPRLGLPTGRATAYLLKPGSGDLQMVSPGLTPGLDLIYSRAKGRWVYGAGAGYMAPQTRNGIRLGNEARAMFDAEYLIWRSGDKEINLVFGAVVRKIDRARESGRRLMETGGANFTPSYGIQYAPRPSLAIEAYYKRDAWNGLRIGQPRMDAEISVGLRLLR